MQDTFTRAYTRPKGLCSRQAKRAHDDMVSCIQSARASKGILHTTILQVIVNNARKCHYTKEILRNCSLELIYLLIHPYSLYARYLCSRDALGLKAARPSARATIGYIVYNLTLSFHTEKMRLDICPFNFKIR